MLLAEARRLADSRPLGYIIWNSATLEVTTYIPRSESLGARNSPCTACLQACISPSVVFRPPDRV